LGEAGGNLAKLTREVRSCAHRLMIPRLELAVKNPLFTYRSPEHIRRMPHKPTDEELALFNDISSHASVLWEKSERVTGLNHDPKMFSIMLFKRLWSNHRGYIVLWNNRLQTESDLVLRSGIEASICLAANFKLREEFVSLMRGDAIFTLKGQIKMYREEGSLDMVGVCEAALRDLQSRFPADSKLGRLNWATLARRGEVPHLYAWHRQLSGVSSHVTGLSVLTGVVPVEGEDPTAELGPMQRKMHLMMMAGATLQGCLQHGGMLNDLEAMQETITLLNRLSELSFHWPGVGLSPQ
jgi:hypothetical protein